MSSANIRPLRRQPYGGSQLGIVIGIDVGTTFSGVSYAILRPGEVPNVLSVTRFPGSTTGVQKIPTAIFYNDKQEIKATGLETTVDTFLAENQGCLDPRYFKMRLRPSNMALQTNGLDIGELPDKKSAEDVMGDFLRHLFKATASYIQSSHVGEADIWDQVKDDAIFVLGHPNGWTGQSLQRYRKSAILGGLIPDTAEGRKRVKFVTEGEASALACLSGGLGPARLEVGFRFVIVDAGGGTLDISSYEVTKSSPVEFKLCAPPDCRFAGSLFVNGSGLELLRGKLRNSSYDRKDKPESFFENKLKRFIDDEFEKKTKRLFSVDSEYGLLKVGDSDERDENFGIRNGYLRLNCNELSECFSTSVTEALDSIRSQVIEISKNYETIPVWLVGGFASSPYLFERLKNSLEPEGVRFQRPDTNLEKAVANGAVLHFLDNPVTSRVCPASYGTTCLIPFMPFLSNHQERSDLLHEGINGVRIGPVFDCIVEKGTLIEEGRIFKESYVQNFFFKSMAKEFTAEILIYDGDLPPPMWYEENKDKFRTLCTLEADLSELYTESSRNAFVPRLFWKAEFEIELKVGTAELEASIKWEANGETKS
ncbi:hypothetical protein DFH11DRAFT_862716 [Phellopilus nigrolimitatus]|nr:hypothetical protein DFH11DRAFT_862716 [Phellopilus nigrolimitatus]